MAIADHFPSLRGLSITGYKEHPPSNVVDVSTENPATSQVSAVDIYVHIGCSSWLNDNPRGVAKAVMKAFPQVQSVRLIVRLGRHPTGIVPEHQRNSLMGSLTMGAYNSLVIGGIGFLSTASVLPKLEVIFSGWKADNQCVRKAAGLSSNDIGCERRLIFEMKTDKGPRRVTITPLDPKEEICEILNVIFSNPTHRLNMTGVWAVRVEILIPHQPSRVGLKENKPELIARVHRDVLSMLYNASNSPLRTPEAKSLEQGMKAMVLGQASHERSQHRLESVHTRAAPVIVETIIQQSNGEHHVGVRMESVLGLEASKWVIVEDAPGGGEPSSSASAHGFWALKKSAISIRPESDSESLRGWLVKSCEIKELIECRDWEPELVLY